VMLLWGKLIVYLLFNCPRRTKLSVFYIFFALLHVTSPQRHSRYPLLLNFTQRMHLNKINRPNRHGCLPE
jgi:hypothetical protein